MATINGREVELKSLTARQVTMLRNMTDADESNIVAISLSARMDKADVVAWYDHEDTRAGDVLRIVQEVFEVSGLGEGAQKSG